MTDLIRLSRHSFRTCAKLQMRQANSDQTVLLAQSDLCLLDALGLVHELRSLQMQSKCRRVHTGLKYVYLYIE